MNGQVTRDGQDGQAVKGPKRTAEFWRACRFLYAHRGIVLVSVCCAFFVGAAFTGGLGTILPIMKILIDGDSVPNWMNRQLVEKRLDAQLAQEGEQLRLVDLSHKSPLAKAGWRKGDRLVSPDGRETGTGQLRHLSDPQTTEAAFGAPDGTVHRIALEPVKPHWVVGRSLAGHVPTDPVYAIATVMAVIIVLTSLGNGARFFQEYLSDKAAVLTVNDIRRKLYDHVLHLPLGYFALRGGSDLTSRLVQDAQGLETGFKTVLGQTIQEPIKAAMYFAVAMYFDWRLTAFIVLFAPVMVAIIRKFGKKMRRASKKALQNSSVMLGQIDATLAGLRVVKSVSGERFERRRYRRIMDSLVAQQLKMSRIDAFSTPVMEMLTLAVVGVVVLFAAAMIFWWGKMDRTDFFMVMAALVGIGDSLRRLGKVNNVLSKASAAAGRIFEILEVPVEKPRELVGGGPWAAGSKAWTDAKGDGRATVKLPRIAQEIRFENVTFAYPNSPAPAVEEVSLAIPKGQSVAVVGRNGSGKTTLLALLPRFYDPQHGRVLIDGVDVRMATLRSLRRQIGIVTQDSVIFPGTLADNIAYGMPHPDRARVEEAARRAFAHEFILEKPQGYDTLVGEGGSGLSGGQKQRLCIARAIYRDTPILILDEATSQVDAESEHLIQQAIEGLMQQRTTFVIAHRFSTILSADRIVVMDRGKIVGQGKHEELLNTCATYQQLYERQLIATPA